MSRRIQTRRVQALGPGAGVADTYFDKVVKYIPADIVGAWIAVAGLIAGATEVPPAALYWVVFAAATVLTPIWTWRQTQEEGKPMAYTQIAIATGAFVVWVFALGGPFANLDFYSPLYGSLLLIFYTLVVGLVNPPEG